MTSSPIRILWNLHTNRPRVYLSDIPNFVLIKHKRVEIQGREVNRELWRKKWELRHCDLDLWPKVTKFNRVWATNRSNHLAKTASKLVHPFGWNFVHKNFWTHTHRDTQTNCSENSTISWRCKNLLWMNDKYAYFNFVILNYWDTHNLSIKFVGTVASIVQNLISLFWWFCWFRPICINISTYRQSADSFVKSQKHRWSPQFRLFP